MLQGPDYIDLTVEMPLLYIMRIPAEMCNITISVFFIAGRQYDLPFPADVGLSSDQSRCVA